MKIYRTRPVCDFGSMVAFVSNFTYQKSSYHFKVFIPLLNIPVKYKFTGLNFLQKSRKMSFRQVYGRNPAFKLLKRMDPRQKTLGDDNLFFARVLSDNNFEKMLVETAGF